MTVPFDPTRRTIIVRAEITGPTGTGTVDLTLDTGSTDTFVDDARLAAVGYTPAHVTNQFQVVTGSGIVSVFEVPVMTITALGQSRTNYPVLAHGFPPAAAHDGVLGLDFLRGNVLTIDFVKGEIALTPGGSTP
ncbi:MAG TPA: retropepsin-like aspartic protease [Gemmataceae bacterium]|nr:retropepsin-like aspartic protease [Gemmataceae bacterium]